MPATGPAAAARAAPAIVDATDASAPPPRPHARVEASSRRGENRRALLASAAP